MSVEDIAAMQQDLVAHEAGATPAVNGVGPSSASTDVAVPSTEAAPIDPALLDTSKDDTAVTEAAPQENGTASLQDESMAAPTEGDPSESAVPAKDVQEEAPTTADVAVADPTTSSEAPSMTVNGTSQTEGTETSPPQQTFSAAQQDDIAAALAAVTGSAPVPDPSVTLESLDPASTVAETAAPPTAQAPQASAQPVSSALPALAVPDNNGASALSSAASTPVPPQNETPSSSSIAPAQSSSGLSARKPQQALTRLAKLRQRIDKDRFDGEAWLELISDAVQKGDLDRTREMYEGFLQAFPDNVGPFLRRLRGASLKLAKAERRGLINEGQHSDTCIFSFPSFTIILRPCATRFVYATLL